MKKNQNLFSIGEVAQALDITRRAILYYEELGLIQPDVKDSATGNRYYTIDTFVKIRTIRILQNLGLSLRDVRGYFEGAFDLPPLIQRLEKLRDELDRHIESLKERSNTQPQVKLVRFPRQTAAFIRHLQLRSERHCSATLHWRECDFTARTFLTACTLWSHLSVNRMRSHSVWPFRRRAKEIM